MSLTSRYMCTQSRICACACAPLVFSETCVMNAWKRMCECVCKAKARADTCVLVVLLSLLLGPVISHWASKQSPISSFTTPLYPPDPSVSCVCGGVWVRERMKKEIP